MSEKDRSAGFCGLTATEGRSSHRQEICSRLDYRRARNGAKSEMKHVLLKSMLQCHDLFSNTVAGIIDMHNRVPDYSSDLGKSIEIK